jgi:uncharacterized tellurite resistance protein B-like protein
MGKRRDGLNDRVTLIQAMVAIAHSDGEFADVERDRIERLMDFLRLDPAARAYVDGLLAGGVAPEMPPRAELPKYETRLYIFQHALIMAYEDGVLSAGEQTHLASLAEHFELSPEDVDKGWARAREMVDQD